MQPSFSPGQQVGPYKIVSRVGAGGMGEVFRAHDSRLKRDVAIKVLPAALAADADRVKRFEQEARAAGQLNHPNIMAVHDIGTHEGRPYLVCELLEGQTLRERLATAIPNRKSIEYAIEIARGLEAAHRKGIVHRDLKPENIFLTRDGRLKILDFGLAKLTERPQRPIGAEAATITAHSDPGTVMGTAGYMAPEQIRGQLIDPRTDLFTFGSIFYEMLSGRRAFLAPTTIETMNAILNEDPAEYAPPGQESALDRIALRCLEKEPARRFQSAADLVFALEETSNSSGAYRALAETDAIRTPWRLRAPAAAAIVLAGLAGGYFWGRRSVPRPSPPQFEAITDHPGPELYPSLAPDGKSITYAARADGHWDIHVQRVGGKNPSNLTKESEANDIQPAFSPDGQRIAFRSERDSGGIYVMGATGESVRRITNFGYNPRWSPDGKELIFATESVARPEIRSTVSSQIWMVNIESGATRRVPIPWEDGVQPVISPHAKRIVFWSSRAGGRRDLFTVKIDGRDPRPLTSDSFVDWNPVWTPDGRFIYFSSDRGGSMNIWRVAIDEESGSALDEAEPVMTPSGDSGMISFSDDGKHMAYLQSTQTANLQRAAFDSPAGRVTGAPEPITQGSRQAHSPDASPGGSWLAYFSLGKREELFLIRADGTGLRQLTDDGSRNRMPRWSPDGTFIAFFSTRGTGGSYSLYTIRPDGSETRQLTAPAKNSLTYPVWSPDGKRLAFFEQSVGSFIVDYPQVSKKEALPNSGDGLPTVYSWSPDGARIAGTLESSGQRAGLFAYSIAERKVEKLLGHGDHPLWLSDSRRLLFQHKGRLHLLDSTTKQAREVLSVAPYEIAPRGVALSKDNRHLYFSLATNEADIWMMSTR